MSKFKDKCDRCAKFDYLKSCDNELLCSKCIEDKANNPNLAIKKEIKLEQIKLNFQLKK